jgi:hypothetical protein
MNDAVPASRVAVSRAFGSKSVAVAEAVEGDIAVVGRYFIFS